MIPIPCFVVNVFRRSEYFAVNVIPNHLDFLYYGFTLFFLLQLASRYSFFYTSLIYEIPSFFEMVKDGGSTVRAFYPPPPTSHEHQFYGLISLHVNFHSNRTMLFFYNNNLQVGEKEKKPTLVTMIIVGPPVKKKQERNIFATAFLFQINLW